jgi:hypothetical protein
MKQNLLTYILTLIIVFLCAQLTICEKIVDENKFLETHELRAKIAIEANKMFVERLKLYHIIKQNR